MKSLELRVKELRVWGVVGIRLQEHGANISASSTGAVATLKPGHPGDTRV